MYFETHFKVSTKMGEKYQNGIRSTNKAKNLQKCMKVPKIYKI